MASIDRHEIHQFLCMGLDHSAQYEQCDGLMRFLLTLPRNGTRRQVSAWLEQFSPYKVLWDQEQRPISLIRIEGRGFDPSGAASTPYWKLAAGNARPAP